MNSIKSILFTIVVFLNLIQYIKAQQQTICRDGEMVCKIDLTSASPNAASYQCYDPNNYTCSQNLLCPVTSPNRCGDVCYAGGSEGFVCHENTHQCPASIPALCGGICYSEEQHECINDEIISFQAEN